MRRISTVAVVGKSIEQVEADIRKALLDADVVGLTWPHISDLLSAEPGTCTVRVARWAEERFQKRWTIQGDHLYVDREDQN